MTTLMKQLMNERKMQRSQKFGAEYGIMAKERQAKKIVGMRTQYRPIMSYAYPMKGVIHVETSDAKKSTYPTLVPTFSNGMLK